MDPLSRRAIGAIPTALGALLSAALFVAAMTSALHSEGGVFPSLFVDPFGYYSSVSLPGWKAVDVDLGLSDRLIEADGAPLAASNRRGDFTSQRLARHLAERARAGASKTTLTFDRAGSLVHRTRPIRRLGAGEGWFFFGAYALMAALVLWSGFAVRALATDRNASAVYGAWSVASSLFLLSFFDYHTEVALAPLFSLATLAVPACFLWLAWAFPRPPAGAPRWLRLSARCAAVLWGVAAAWTLASPSFALDTLPIRRLVNVAAPGAAVVLAISILVRGTYARGDEHRQLRTAAWTMGTLTVLVGLSMGAALVSGSALFHLIVPFATIAVPGAVGFALVRYNLLGANAVLTRRLLLTPIVLFALWGAAALWRGLRNDGGHDPWQIVASMTSGGLFVAVIALLRRLSDRMIFPAAAAFRPTIAQLAESLADLRGRAAVARALEETVRRWLPSTGVRFVEPDVLAEIGHLPDDAPARLARGEKLWTEESPWERHLVVPLRSHGALRGVLDIAPKHQGALFTEEDLALLDTIAALGAIALHNAEILAALDASRRMELDATREDKRLTLGTLGAELSHEIAHPLSFFRTLLRRAARRPIDQEDVEIGEEEIARMDRMLQSLRRLEVPAPRLAPVPLREPAARAFVLARERIGERGLREEVDLPAGCVVDADADGLVQVFANLLRNAAQAARGAVGVRAARAADGSLTIDVWDDGPGVPEELAPRLFQRWVTGRPADGGTGLGLSVAQQIVVNFGWKILYVRDGDRTCFRVVVPADKVRLADA